MVKKPKKKQETHETSEEVPVSAPQKPDFKSKKRKRQESKGEPVEIEAVEEPAATKDADAAERLRRALQRDIQQLVLRLRSEGKSKSQIKAATQELKAQHGAVSKSKSKSLKSSKKKKWEANAAERRKTHLQRQHDLVVIPVVWRGRHDKLDVLQAAENVKACLAQQGLDVWLDSRRHLTPGQKFSHWEHRGVMLRVEIGPQDLQETEHDSSIHVPCLHCFPLQAQVCQVCKAKTAGDYQSVERKQVPLPPAGARSLLLRLKEWGLSQLDVERRDGDSEDEAPEVQGRHQKAKEAKAASEEHEVQGNWQPRAATTGKKKKGKVRGKKDE